MNDAQPLQPRSRVQNVTATMNGHSLEIMISSQSVICLCSAAADPRLPCPSALAQVTYSQTPVVAYGRVLGQCRNAT